MMKISNLKIRNLQILMTLLGAILLNTACNGDQATQESTVPIQTESVQSVLQDTTIVERQTRTSIPAKMEAPTTEVKTATSVTAPKTDLHTAVLKNDIEAVKQHIAAGSDLNIKESIGGSTPLISAALFGRTEIAKLLINGGALLNIQNNEGSTALITSSFFCRPEIVKMLLAKHADKTIKNKYGSAAFETVNGPFQDTKPIYDMMLSALSPLGLKLDYDFVEKTRPAIAEMLK